MLDLDVGVSEDKFIEIEVDGRKYKYFYEDEKAMLKFQAEKEITLETYWRNFYESHVLEKNALVC